MKLTGARQDRHNDVYGRGSPRERHNGRPGNRSVPIRLNGPLACFYALPRPLDLHGPQQPAVRAGVPDRCMDGAHPGATIRQPDEDQLTNNCIGRRPANKSSMTAAAEAYRINEWPLTAKTSPRPAEPQPRRPGPRRKCLDRSLLIGASSRIPFAMRRSPTRRLDPSTPDASRPPLRMK